MVPGRGVDEQHHDVGWAVRGRGRRRRGRGRGRGGRRTGREGFTLYHSSGVSSMIELCEPSVTVEARRAVDEPLSKKRHNGCRRNAESSEVTALRNLAATQLGNAKETKRQESANDALQFLPPIPQVMCWTCLAMAGTLASAVAFSASGAGTIYGLSVAIGQVAGEDDLDQSSNSTAPVAAFDEQRHYRAVVACSAVVSLSTSVAGFMEYSRLCSWSIDQQSHPLTRSLTANWLIEMLLLFAPMTLSFLIVILYFALGGVEMSPYVLGSVMVLGATGTTIMGSTRGVLLARGSNIAVARRWARGKLKRLEEGRVEETAGHNSQRGGNGGDPGGGVRQRVAPWRRAILVALPILLVDGVLLVYLIGVFAAFRAASSVAAKTAVFVFSLAVKGAGNKLQIAMIMKNPKSSLWLSDIMVFFYEFATALLSRLLLLSIPDEGTALLLSLANVLLEMMIRSWYYMNYICVGAKAGLEGWEHVHVPTQPPPTTPDGAVRKREYQRAGEIRVLDATNDMVVEYVSSAVAAAMLLWLPSTGAFLLTESSAEDTVEPALLALLVACQIGPEILIDGFMCALETRGGLLAQYQNYWRRQSAFLVVVKAIVVMHSVSFVLCTAIVAD